MPVEVVAVAIHAVLDVGLAARRDVLLEARLVTAQRIVDAGDVDLLAPELDRTRRRRVHRAQLRRRLGGRRRLRVGVVTEQDRQHDRECRPHEPPARIDQRGPDRADEGAPGIRVGGDVDEHREEHDGQVDLDHAPGRGGPDAEPQYDEGEHDDEDRLDEARAEEAHAGIISASAGRLRGRRIPSPSASDRTSVASRPSDSPRRCPAPRG